MDINNLISFISYHSKLGFSTPFGDGIFSKPDQEFKVTPVEVAFLIAENGDFLLTESGVNLITE